MHEQLHQTTTTDEKIEPTREETIREIAEPMQVFALENFLQSNDDIKQAVRNGHFSRLIKIKNTVILQVIMTISPADDEDREPFWHCSMSLASAESGRPKPVVLFTKSERSSVKKLLSEFLGERGIKKSQGYMQTKTALHCYRDLTAGELYLIHRNSAEPIETDVSVIQEKLDEQFEFQERHGE